MEGLHQEDRRRGEAFSIGARADIGRDRHLADSRRLAHWRLGLPIRAVRQNRQGRDSRFAVSRFGFAVGIGVAKNGSCLRLVLPQMISAAKIMRNRTAAVIGPQRNSGRNWWGPQGGRTLARGGDGEEGGASARFRTETLVRHRNGGAGG